MTVMECYEAMQGNYQEAIGRLLKDDRIQKYLIKFLNDKNYEKLIQSMDEKNYEEAFAAAHTLKGLSQNMALTSLSKPVEELTEHLRNGHGSDADAALVEQIKERYDIVKKAIAELQNSSVD